jgi:alanine dehydrogenase
VRVGIPREVKNYEHRVAITPAGVRELVCNGHRVVIEHNAGAGSSILDEDYEAAGALIAQDRDKVWSESELLLKVEQPRIDEYHLLRKDLVLFAYLHLAADVDCTNVLIDSGTTSIAYESVQLPDGSLPLLAPMSEVAGRLAPQIGAYYLTRQGGGRGILLSGGPGVAPAHVVVLGCGVSGQNAAVVAIGMGAHVTVLDKDVARLRRFDSLYGGQLHTIAANAYEIDAAVAEADLVIGAVLVPGAKAPRLVSSGLTSKMRPGSVLVDLSIDQGGCFEGSRPTTHSDPVYAFNNCTFYCVTNMPGVVPHTSTYALTNATLPYVLELANLGCRNALLTDASLAAGLNTHDHALTNQAVAATHGYAYRPTDAALEP